MDMPIDAKRIVDKLTKGGSKKTYAISISEDLMEQFKTECEKQGVKYSPVIEELIKEFIDSSKKKK